MPEEQTPEPTAPYLKNAWAKKDTDGDYWLFITGGDLKAMFRLSGTEDGEDSIPRRALAAWLADQNEANGTGKGDFRGS